MWLTILFNVAFVHELINTQAVGWKPLERLRKKPYGLGPTLSRQLARPTLIISTSIFHPQESFDNLV